MQSSRIYADGEIIFEMATKPSEWLFSVKFWNEVNEQCNTFFDQYEEDNLTEVVGSVVVNKLEELCQKLELETSGDIEFCRGWNADGELRESISKDILLNAISEFKYKLSAAIASGSAISLSL
ncbi:hypothetical protein ACIPLR_22035 [Herbaspirillum huttiense]|jgi:hypothetical protein|uniref:hypothetical protein n=1 Tax=Herbaspirillum huttiense TaxID=863372 RepID=UPI00381D7BFD